MGYRVKELDIVKFNGRTLKSEKKQYLLLNKPRIIHVDLIIMEKEILFLN